MDRSTVLKERRLKSAFQCDSIYIKFVSSNTKLYCCWWGWPIFCKGHDSKYFRLSCPVVSVATAMTLLCHWCKSSPRWFMAVFQQEPTHSLQVHMLEIKLLLKGREARKRGRKWWPWKIEKWLLLGRRGLWSRQGKWGLMGCWQCFSETHMKVAQIHTHFIAVSWILCRSSMCMSQ